MNESIMGAIMGAMPVMCLAFIYYVYTHRATRRRCDRCHAYQREMAMYCARCGRPMFSTRRNDDRR